MYLMCRLLQTQAKTEPKASATKQNQYLLHILIKMKIPNDFVGTAVITNFIIRKLNNLERRQALYKLCWLLLRHGHL